MTTEKKKPASRKNSASSGKRVGGANKGTIVNSSAVKKKAILEALRGTMKNVTQACEKVGIARKVFYQWMKEDPDFKEAVDNMDEIILDFVESSLFSQIREKNTTATIFYLKTKGKHRGYIERNELTGADGKDLTPGPIMIEVIDRREQVKKDEDSDN